MPKFNFDTPSSNVLSGRELLALSMAGRIRMYQMAQTR